MTFLRSESYRFLDFSLYRSFSVQEVSLHRRSTPPRDHLCMIGYYRTCKKFFRYMIWKGKQPFVANIECIVVVSKIPIKIVVCCRQKWMKTLTAFKTWSGVTFSKVEIEFSPKIWLFVITLLHMIFFYYITAV